MRMTSRVARLLAAWSCRCTSQNTGVPGVSAMNTCGVHTPSLGTAVTVSQPQPRLTSLRYQPLQSLGAGVQA